MDYEREFVKGIGREDISGTAEGLKKDLLNEVSREKTWAKYGVFLRGICETLIQRHKIPISVDQDSLVDQFLVEKFLKLLELYSKRKGSFRAYLRVSFINFLIDTVYKNEKEKNASLSFDIPEISIGNDEEQLICEDYDQESLHVLFQELEEFIQQKKEISLLFEYYSQREQLNSFLFSMDDFQLSQNFANTISFITKLHEAPDSVSQYIWENCSFQTKELLEKATETQVINKTLQQALVKELNLILRDDCFYNKERFKEIILSETILQLIEKDPQGRALNALNRMLLESVYPEEIISQTTKVPKDAENFLPKYQRKKAESEFKQKALSLLQEHFPSLRLLQEEDIQELLQYFVKLYFREKFSPIHSG